MKTKKVAILGGSNSIVKFGFSYGLKHSLEVDNLSLGASTSLQRVHQLVKLGHKINEYDYFIIDSLVNDIHAFHSAKIPYDLLKYNIFLMYKSLALTGIPVVAVLFPIDMSNTSFSHDVVKDIYDIHLLYINEFGFNVVDLVKSTKNINSPILFHDNLHINSCLSYEVGTNLGIWLADLKSFKRECIPLESYFSYFDVTEMKSDFELINHSNSLFSRVSAKISDYCFLFDDCIDSKRSYIIGLETWNEKPVKLQVSSEVSSICKLIGGENIRFNELQVPVNLDNLRLNVDNSLKVTELSINHPPVNDLIDYGEYLFLTSFLIQHDKEDFDSVKVIDSGNVVVISDLLNLFPAFSYSCKILSSKKSIVSFDRNVPIDNIANYARDAAVELESIKPKLSYRLMCLAQLCRPNGLFIKRKVAEYRSRLIV